MKLNVKTNAGNQVREDIMAIVQQQWGAVGIEVETEAVEWNAYLDILLGQKLKPKPMHTLDSIRSTSNVMGKLSGC